MVFYSKGDFKFTIVKIVYLKASYQRKQGLALICNMHIAS